MKTTKSIRSEAKQLLRLCYVDGLFDDSRAQTLLQRFLQAKPRGCLAILDEFDRLVKLQRAQHAATVESATTLPPEVATDLQAILVQIYGPEVKISFAENPALIGGVRITVGSDVYDGSVRGRLAALERRWS